MKILTTACMAIALAGFIWSTVLFVMAAMYGKQLSDLRRQNKLLTPEGFVIFAKHKECFTRFVITLLVAVFFIELPKLVSGEHGSSSALFAWHISFVVAFVVTLLFMFYFNGKDHPGVHAVLFVPIFHLYIFMIAFGLPLMYQAVMKYYN
jgi:hypothetical protein